MAILTKGTVQLKSYARNKENAIRQAGALLVQVTAVSPPYINAMVARERVLSTYIGNGIAIPHGERKDLELVHQTGVSVLQLPEGVEWDPGEKAFLVLGLASKTDELAGLLSNLLEILDDPAAIKRLVTTSDPMMIVARLTGSE